MRATDLGWQVALLEAAPTLGGRARRIEHQGLFLDNGPHLLIGAYTHTLALMRQLGLDPERLLWRMPLNLRNPQGMGLSLPDLPPPWNLLWGITASNALDWRDKLSLLGVAARHLQLHPRAHPRSGLHWPGSVGLRRPRAGPLPRHFGRGRAFRS